MKKDTAFFCEPFGEIRVIRSRRRTTSISCDGTGGLLVRAPLFSSNRDIIRLLQNNEVRLLSMLRSFSQQQEEAQKQGILTQQELRQLSKQAASVLKEKADIYARKIGVSYHRITIRTQKTRWGSCSSQKNLNFNCLLMLCPEEVQDYVVVHELCHIRQMNHSPAFWSEVERILPDYKKQRKWLKENGKIIMERVDRSLG